MAIIRYGTSGNPPNFFSSEYGKDAKNAIDWIHSIGLNAYEYCATHGANTKEEKAAYIGKRAKELDVKLSVHGAYYIVLTSEHKNVQENSVKEMIKTLKLAEMLGADKIVFHPGFNKSGDAVEKCIAGLKMVMGEYPSKVKMLPETTGKKCQLGSLEDVLTICEETGCLPCIDFGHLHAREGGQLKSEDDIRNIIIKIEKRLGKKAIKYLHCHFYPIEFTSKGEKVHRAVTEPDYYPKFKHFAPIIKEFNMAPTLISESKNSQDVGALEMKSIMENL